MTRHKFHVQQAEVKGWGNSFSVVGLANCAPFLTAEEERLGPQDPDPYEIRWWEKRLNDIFERSALEQGLPGRGLVLDYVLELYDYYGWEHYDTALTSKQHPEHVQNADDATTTLLLFFRKAVAENQSGR